MALCLSNSDTRERRAAMTVRTRKFFGMLALITLLVIYALTAMVYTATHLEGASVLRQLVIYVSVGLAWVIPAGILVTWMQRPDPEA
jgi:hypothetical protein